MASKLTAQYVAEAQAGTKSKSEKQPVRGGDYAAQGQLDQRVSRDIAKGHSERQTVQYRPFAEASVKRSK